MSAEPKTNNMSPDDWKNIRTVQAEITRWASATFPHRTDHHAIYKLMVNEIPEMMMHKQEHGLSGIGLELADCFILLMDLATLWGVDLATAIRDKMEINYSRTWNMDENGIMQHNEEDSPSETGPYPCPYCRSDQDVRTATEQEVLAHKAVESHVDAFCTGCKIFFDSSLPF